MTRDYSGYVDPDYLDAAARLLLPSKLRTYELMELQEGHRVLDLGCGPASDTIALAGIVGETGRVVGVDADAEMVAEANERASAAELAGRVTHDHADAAFLPFDDDSFDACRSERVFQHLPDPTAALAELIRVTRPGGKVIVVDAGEAADGNAAAHLLAQAWEAMGDYMRDEVALMESRGLAVEREEYGPWGCVHVVAGTLTSTHAENT